LIYKDSYDRTPLSWAAENGHTLVVELLLATGKSDVDSKDNTWGQTPLSWAAESGHTLVVEQLLATGKADVNSKDYLAKADIELRNINGWSPLLRAAANGHAAIVKLLQPLTSSFLA
jgi:ankyrin repeat protein